MKAFKVTRSYPHQQTKDVLLEGATFDDGTTIVQFPLPTRNLGIFKSFKDFKEAYKRLFEPEQKTELIETEI